MLDTVKALLVDRLPEAEARVHSAAGDDVLTVRRESIRAVCRTLKYEPELDYRLVSDLTAVDRLAHPDYRPGEPRFEVVYQLYSLTRNHRLRVKTAVPEDDPVLDSVTGVWKVADWLEREVWDMFGIRFAGHPNLKRLLMYEEFVGHPLRKDYPLKGHQPIVPLRRPIELREDPRHQSSAWEQAHFVPLPLDHIDNEKRLPVSMLAPAQATPASRPPADLEQLAGTPDEGARRAQPLSTAPSKT